MHNSKVSIRIASLRTLLGVISVLALVSGCDRQENHPVEKGDKKPAYERVLVLKQRFAQLETSLDDMEQDLVIQKKRIEATREMASSIKRSLVSGNLKGYSLDTVSSDPMVINAMEKRQEKVQEKEVRAAKKDSSDDTVLNAILLVLFLVFIVTIFWIALKERHQASPYEAAPKAPYPEPLQPKNGLEEAGAESAAGDSPPFQYGELRPQEKTDIGTDIKNELMPSKGDEPDTPPEHRL